MRSGLTVFLVLLVCAVFLLSGTLQAVNAGQDKISVEEQTLFGDASDAEGLVIETYLNKSNRLFWTSACQAGKEPVIETDFQYRQHRYSQPSQEREPRVDFSAGSSGFGISGVVDAAFDAEHHEFMLAPVFAVAETMGPGETKTEIVRLNAYYDWFSVDLSISRYGTMDDEEVRKEQTEFLESYFRIPIPDDVYWEVYVETDAAGRIINCSCSEYKSPEEEDYSNIYTYSDSFLLNDAIYLLPIGNADYTQIKGGYGIYRIPIAYLDSWQGRTFSEPKLHALVEEIENVYPLDPADSENLSLEKGPNGELLLFRLEQGETLLQVLEPADLSVRQELHLSCPELPELCCMEDAFVLFTDRFDPEDGRIWVISEENGAYALWTEAKLFPMHDEGAYYDPVLAFDNNRFAMAVPHSLYRTVSCRVLVYGPSGLVYAGDYCYNCDTLPEERLPETFNWVDPLQISWKVS